jgi:hypothetical protein
MKKKMDGIRRLGVPRRGEERKRGGRRLRRFIG